MAMAWCSSLPAGLPLEPPDLDAEQQQLGVAAA